MLALHDCDCKSKRQGIQSTLCRLRFRRCARCESLIQMALLRTIPALKIRRILIEVTSRTPSHEHTQLWQGLNRFAASDKETGHVRTGSAGLLRVLVLLELV